MPAGATAKPWSVVSMSKAAALYFALVFGAGFALGFVRVLWIVPRVGERTAELVEAPIMLVVSVLAARWIVRRLAVPPSRGTRIGVGLLALGFLLSLELTVVLWLRGLTLSEYCAGRDPVSGSVYIILLVLFAIMPLLVVRR
jgi:hypothetical protein